MIVLSDIWWTKRKFTGAQLDFNGQDRERPNTAWDWSLPWGSCSSLPSCGGLTRPECRTCWAGCRTRRCWSRCRWCTCSRDRGCSLQVFRQWEGWWTVQLPRRLSPFRPERDNCTELSVILFVTQTDHQVIKHSAGFQSKNLIKDSESLVFWKAVKFFFQFAHGVEMYLQSRSDPRKNHWKPPWAS